MDLARIERALIVDTPWIDRILDDGKTWEMRSRATRLRGPIGLIQSRTGCIVGVAELVGCHGPLSPDAVLASVERHHIPAELIRSGAVAKWNTAWVLRGARRLFRPLPYRHPQGAVVWVALDPETRAALAASPF